MEECIYGVAEESAIKYAVKQGLTPEEFFERAETKERYDEIVDALNKYLGVEPAAPEVPIEPTVRETHSVALGVSLSMDASIDLPTQLKDMPEDVAKVMKERIDMAKKISDLVDHEQDMIKDFERMASQIVADKVHLLVEPNSQVQLSKALSETWVGQQKGDSTKKKSCVFMTINLLEKR